MTDETRQTPTQTVSHADIVRELRWRSTDLDFDRECRVVFGRAADLIEQLFSAAPQTARDSWPEIDSELTAYAQTIRAELIEECAREALRCDTHALFCMADPTAIRQDIAQRIRTLAMTRPQREQLNTSTPAVVAATRLPDCALCERPPRNDCTISMCGWRGRIGATEQLNTSHRPEGS